MTDKMRNMHIKIAIIILVAAFVLPIVVTIPVLRAIDTYREKKTEASAYDYEDVKRWSKDETDLKPDIQKAMADGKLTQYEYDRIRDKYLDNAQQRADARKQATIDEIYQNLKENE